MLDERGYIQYSCRDKDFGDFTVVSTFIRRKLNRLSCIEMGWRLWSRGASVLSHPDFGEE